MGTANDLEATGGGSWLQHIPTRRRESERNIGNNWGKSDIEALDPKVESCWLLDQIVIRNWPCYI